MIQNIVDAEKAEHKNEDMEYEDNGNSLDDGSSNISCFHPDPVGHHRRFSELQTEQYELEENVRQWRLEQEIDLFVFCAFTNLDG